MDDRRAVFALHAAVAAAIAVTQSRVPAERLYNTRRGGLSRRGRVRLLPDRDCRGGHPAPVARSLRLAALPLCATVGRPRRGRRAAPRRAAAQRAGTRRRRPGRAGAGRRSAAAAAATGRGFAPHWPRHSGWCPSHGCWRAPGCRPPVWRSPRRASPASTASTSDTTRAWTARCSPGTRCSLSRRRTGTVHSWYLALMLTYGVAVAAQDAWLEQVVKRGWTSRRIPDVVRPAATPAWAALLAATPLVRRL